MIRVRAPGKVVLAGEYAVLLEGAPCLVAAVDRHLEVRASSAPRWSARSGDVSWEEGADVPEALSFVIAAIEAVRRRWPAAMPKALETHDGLRDGQGRKLGLGGSAAATVAAVRAAADGTGATRAELWAVSDGVHRQVQGGRGSGVDVASAVHGGVVRYVREPRQATSLAVHPDVRLVLAWTGESARTSIRLPLFDAFVKSQADEARRFLEASTEAVERLARGLEAGDPDSIRDGMQQARASLQRLETHLGFEIETPALAKAAEVASRAGAAGKLSGAGGGDCAVIVALGEETAVRVADELASAGLEPVRVSLSGGVDVVEP